MNHTPRSAAPGRTSSSGGFLSLVGGLLATLLKLGALLLGFVLMLGALLVGAALALALVGWALLRGRRPQAQVFSSSFQRMRRPRAPGFGAGQRQRPADTAGRSAATSAATSAVIDVEVREVPDDGRPTSHLHPER